MKKKNKKITKKEKRLSEKMEKATFKYGDLNNKNKKSKNAFKKTVATSTLGRKIFKGFVFTIFLVFLTGISFLLYVYFFIAPPARELPQRMSQGTTVLYDRAGEHVLYEIHGEENRKTVSHEEIPEVVRKSTIATEDASFYNHHGIDTKSIFRALLINIRDKKLSQGASTITQQLARNIFLDREKTFKRKFLEMVIAFKMEMKFSKEEILDFYLNQIPYGANAYGIQSAAETFFGKDAKDLTLDEATLLAALPKATTFYSPYGNNKEKLVVRQKIIIQKMNALGFINKKIAEEALATDALAKIVSPQIDIQAPHFVFYVKEILEKWYGPEELEKGGLAVYTTLDYDMQKKAEESIRDGAGKNIKYGANNGALVAVNPRNGELLAMVGSKDYFNSSIDGNVNVAIRLRQPGSSFKPFAYVKAFEKGYQPETMFYDVQTDFGPDGSGKNYVPNNYDGQFHGLVSMRQALAMSLNIPAVKTLYLAGIDETIDLSHRLGITTLNERSRYGLSLVLGGGEVKLVDMTYAFSVFANDGVQTEPSAVLKIVNLKGDVIFSKSEEKKQVIKQQIARKINSILSDNFSRAPVFGTISPLGFKDRQVAAKTGTTQEFRDAWTVGYTPSLAVGVWFGNNDGSFMRPGADGVYVAAPVWRDFMDKILPDLPVEEFKEYEKVESTKPLLAGYVPGKVAYYKITSGKKISESKLNKYRPDEIRQKLEPEKHCILYYVNKDFPLTPAPPNYYDPMLSRWEKALGQEYENIIWGGNPELNFDIGVEKDKQD